MNFQNIQGYNYKTITVTTSAGVREYAITSNYDLGLEENDIILGIFVRYLNPGATQRSASGNAMANPNVYENSFVTIKDRTTATLVYRYNYRSLSQGPLYFEKKRACDVDWSNSKIEISNNCATADIVDDEDFEIIIIYAPCQRYELELGFENRAGMIYENLRYQYFEIALYTGVSMYKLARQNSIGIDEKYYLIGIDMRYAIGSIPAFGTGVWIGSNSCFLTMKQRSYDFVDRLPCVIALDNFSYPEIGFNRPFLPISPVKVKEMDWNNSFLEFKNPAFPTSGNTAALGFIYAVK